MEGFMATRMDQSNVFAERDSVCVKGATMTKSENSAKSFPKIKHSKRNETKRNGRKSIDYIDTAYMGNDSKSEALTKYLLKCGLTHFLPRLDSK